MTKPFFDIGFIVPLLEEFKSFESVFGRIRQQVDDGVQFHTEVDLRVEGLCAVAFLQDDMGKASNARAAEKMLLHYDIGLIVVLGIAGGLSSDISIGDVCFSGTVIDVLENAKVSDDADHTKSAKFSSKFYTTDPRLSFALKYTRIGSDTIPDFENWQLQQYYAAKEKISGFFIGKDSLNEEIGIPTIHEGNIACGAVSKSDVYNNEFRHIDRKILAIETESGGGFHVAMLARVPAVTIRGISDYADKNKNRFERETGGKCREIAAANAVQFVKLQLKNPQFLAFLSETKLSRQALAISAQPTSSLGTLLNEAKQTIHHHLTQLSPEYRGKPFGYRLPLPRMRAASSTTHVSPSAPDDDPISALEVITLNRIIITNVPRNYPDNSLPWIIAAELSLIKIGNKQVIPHVIQGDRIKPPNETIADHCSPNLKAALQRIDVMPVIILTDFPFDSRSRLEFLKREIAKYDHAHFAIINKAELNLPLTIDAVLSLGAESFEICDISFVEISEFLQRTFEMPDEEASVVALRLQNMFKRFDLPAHPSYFAGVAGEVLTSLLRANRRAELLQLAVSGFLSFVVASDKASVVLSRTTREEFLRQLAFEQNVNKRSFSQSSLVEYVREFADARDYEIDPINFISSFKDRGIIHFESDRAVISLPFIESYLLASELAKRPSEAMRYFVLTDPSFDHPTFDIYAEIEPSPAIIQAVIDEAEKVVNDLKSDAGETHILLTNEIRPTILENAGRLPVLQDRLERAFDDVRHNRPQSREKQRLLDIAARVDAVARDKREKSVEQYMGDENWMRLEAAAQIWGLSIILLGSGSERLDKESKRMLAHRVVQLTSQLLDKILRLFPSVEFASLKETLLAEEQVNAFFEMSEESEIETVYDLVRTIIDAYEFQVLGYPIRMFLDHLGNAAGQPVLRPSVASVRSDHAIEEIIARIWAAEIDAVRERASLLTSISALPPSAFLRTTISTFFMTRVYWNHWHQKNRLALLDAAAECLKPLSGQSIDKGKLLRIIQKDASGNNRSQADSANSLRGGDK